MVVQPNGRTMANVKDSHQTIYDDYYGDSALQQKRLIAARMTIDHIRDLVGSRKFAKVADVGAGEGSVVELLANADIASEVTAFEISASGLESIRDRKLPGVAVQAFDGYNAPCADKAFDLAISIHVLEHVEHERMFLHEIKRMSRHAIIEVPLEHTLGFERRVRVMDKFGHINHYTEQTFARLLETAGLKPIKIRTFAVSRELEQFMSGKAKGAIKSAIRRGALKTVPMLARNTFVYICTAFCDCQ
jgi:ubiquinone/menaquinone biosynthesis C-methylase UbiE